MKIILTQQVDGLGAAGDVVDVKDGYGRNFLVPRGFAISWTRGGQKQVDQIKRARGAREIRSHEHAEEVRAQLESLDVRVEAHSGEGGRLFGSVTKADVTQAIKAAGGPLLDKRTVDVEDHIKVVGDYPVVVDLHDGIVAKFTLHVVAD